MYNKIQEALKYIRSKTSFVPKTGIILGTGLGEVANSILIESQISYKIIPHFPISTVESHMGKLIFGYLDGHRIVAMAGRFHYYEGYSMKELTFPIRVLKYLGIDRLIISNAAGGTNPEYLAGDLVFVKDHINLQPENPLRGKNDVRLGPRFPDMLHAYDKTINNFALEIARKHDIRAHEGVYVGLQGPNLETPAEYNFIRIIGGDLVGMSTIPEVIVARHMNLGVFVVSVVTNECADIEAITETTLDEAIEVANSAAPKMTIILKEVLAHLNEKK